MATRGTGYLLLEKDCVSTTEFNGDMYPNGHGDIFFKGISESKTEMGFIDFVETFNSERFNYVDDDLIYSTINHKFYDQIEGELLLIDFNNGYFDRFFSDWVFFKNLTGKTVRFITTKKDEVFIKNGNSIRFNFGRLN